MLHKSTNDTGYKSTEGLISLGEFLLKGGKMTVGMAVVLERSLKTHISASIVDFKEVQEVYNSLTLCRLADNTATVLTEAGEVINRWPFSMMYVPKEQ